MKKVLFSIVCLVALSLAAIPVGAQTRARCNNNNYGRRYDQRTSRADLNVYRDSRYGNQVYSESRYRSNEYSSRYDNNDYYGRDRSVWSQSRDKITTVAGAGAGAVIGGLIGGKRGAIIGAIAGGGGAALYTYKIRDKSRRY